MCLHQSREDSSEAETPEIVYVNCLCTLFLLSVRIQQHSTYLSIQAGAGAAFLWGSSLGGGEEVVVPMGEGQAEENVLKLEQVGVEF